MKKLATIDCTTGIYETEYTLYDDNDQMVVKAPYIKWKNNTGILAFEKVVVGDKERPYVKAMFDAYELVDDDGHTLDDYIFGAIVWV